MAEISALRAKDLADHSGHHLWGDETSARLRKIVIQILSATTEYGAFELARSVVTDIVMRRVYPLNLVDRLAERLHEKAAEREISEDFENLLGNSAGYSPPPRRAARAAQRELRRARGYNEQIPKRPKIKRMNQKKQGCVFVVVIVPFLSPGAWFIV